LKSMFRQRGRVNREKGTPCVIQKPNTCNGPYGERLGRDHQQEDEKGPETCVAERSMPGSAGMISPRAQNFDSPGARSLLELPTVVPQDHVHRHQDDGREVGDNNSCGKSKSEILLDTNDSDLSTRLISFLGYLLSMTGRPSDSEFVEVGAIQAAPYSSSTCA